MARYEYTSWDGVIKRALLTDPDRPGTFVVQTQVELPDLEQNNLRLAELGLEPFGKGTKLVARVPMTVWEQSLHEDWGDDDWRRYLNSADARPFRVWAGRV